MKAVVLVLLLAATLTQPVLAVPAACAMPGVQKMTCAGCCASSRCCAMNQRQQPQPVAAIANAVTNHQLLFTAASSPVAIVRDVSPRPEWIRFEHSAGISHSPAPLALSCIQLI
jgi:hypothetical protein